MKKYIPFIAVILAIALIGVGCGKNPLFTTIKKTSTQAANDVAAKAKLAVQALNMCQVSSLMAPGIGAKKKAPKLASWLESYGYTKDADGYYNYSYNYSYYGYSYSYVYKFRFLDATGKDLFDTYYGYGTGTAPYTFDEIISCTYGGVTYSYNFHFVFDASWNLSSGTMDATWPDTTTGGNYTMHASFTTAGVDLTLTSPDGYILEMSLQYTSPYCSGYGTISYGGTVVAKIYLNADGSGYYTLCDDNFTKHYPITSEGETEQDMY